MFNENMCLEIFWEEELVDGRHPILLYGDSLCTGHPNRLSVDRVDNRADVCELHSQVRSAESTRHKFARLDRQDREFCFCNQVSKFSFVLMALNAASRTKQSHSGA